MKKRSLASLMTICLLVGLLPTAALATEGEPGGEMLCTCTALCTEEDTNETCVVCVEDYTKCAVQTAPDEPEAPVCAEMVGCTDGAHDAECPLYVAPEGFVEKQEDTASDADSPTMEEQLAELIAALPAPEDIDPEDAAQVRAIYEQISAIYAFAEEHGLDAENSETVNAVIAALYPVNTLEETASITASGGSLASGTYTLSEDVTLTTENLTIPASNTVTIDLNGHTLTGNGSGSVITANGTLTIKDSGSSGRITGGVAQSGGGLYVGATGTVNLTGGTITGNTATSTTSTDGGSGVYIAEGGSMTMTGGAIENNAGQAEENAPTAVRGGGIYTNGTLIVTGGTISNNTGKAGGGVYVYKQGTFTMSEDAKIIDNKAVGENSAQGGGVFNFGTLTMNGGTICNNKAGKHGGGICTNTAFKMTGGSITGNSVTCVGGSESETGLGGGVFVNGNASFEMTGGSVTKNTAQTAGGGVWVANQMGVSGSIAVAENTSGEVASNVGLAAGKMLEIADALASNASIGVHLAAESGHVTQNSKTFISQDTLRVITADSSTDVFQIGQDGEVWCNMDDIIADPSEAEAKIGEVYYKTFNSAWENLPIGGSEITILKSLEINEQYVLSQGADVTLTATDEVTISCKAVTPAPDSYFKVSTDASLTLSGTLVLNGTDGSCRAIRVNDYGTFTLTDNAKICSFKNTDTKIGGGAIAASGKNAKVLISGGTLSDNKNESATSGGGAIYCANGILTISGGTIQNNASVSRGGGIYTISGNTAISNDALISGNSVTGTNEYGGGLAINNGKATMTGGTISENTAHTAGSVAVLGSGSFEMSGGSIQGNTTSGGVGSIGVGSIYIIKNASMTMSGGSITQNTASSGGGIANYGTLILTGSGIISKNTIEATKNSAGGGGVYNGGSFTMNGGTISENTVKNKSGTKATNLRGAGVLNYTNGTFILNAGEISGNKFAITDESTIGGGGGIYNLGSCTINGGSIQGHGTENTVFGGAGVFSNYSSASLTISGGEIKNNYSGNNLGSGVRANSGSFAMTGGTITDNTGVSGLYVEPTATFSISGDPIVIGNKNTSDAEKNLYLKENQYITLTGPLTAGAAIGVTTATNPTSNNSVQITAAEDGTEFYKDAAQYFIPDAANVIAEADSTSKYVKLSYTTDTYYKVTLELENITATGGLVTQVKNNEDYTAAISADTGYTLPDAVTSPATGVTLTKNGDTSALLKMDPVTGNTTIKVDGVPNTYTVAFNANGGTGDAMQNQEMTYDTAVNLTENTYTKAGHNFAGWSTTAGGSCEYPDKASIENLTSVNGETVTLYAVWTAKGVIPAFDGAVQSYTYDGNAKAYALTSEIEGFNIAYQQGEAAGAAPTNVGTYDVVITREEDKTYAAFSQTITDGLVITAADYPVTITADAASLTGGGTVTLTANSTVAGITVTGVTCSDESISVIKNDNGTYSATLPNSTKTYTFTATVDGDTGNYGDGPATCTVSVTRRSSGGGGGSSSSNTTTETTTNSDGSKTTTVTDKKTGTVTETTKFKDGSTLVVETKKDGTVTTTETAANDVKVKTVDEPGEDVTAAVTIPRSVGTATVTIPADVDYGMVAVDAKTGEIVKFSIPTEDGMTVKLDGSANLVLEDRSKDFTDTNSHWAEDAIDFATAHELFSGTSDTTFTPDSPMTRAMLMTVLARFDGQDTTGGAVWYETSMSWAKENGISDGSNPNGSISREQLATMLWRYVGSPAGDGSAIGRFTDSGKVNSYAVEAMNWAVGTGLFGGMGDGTLAPQGSATRAQVATILMRFVENLTK